MQTIGGRTARSGPGTRTVKRPDVTRRAGPGRGLFLLFLFISLLTTLPGPLHAQDLTQILTGGATDPPVQSDKVISTTASAQDDRKIRQRLQAIFVELENLKNVRIEVTGGIVTLAGEVDAMADETRAVQLARQVEGVVEVVNDITVNRRLDQRIKSTWTKLVHFMKEFIAGLPLFLLAVVTGFVFWVAGRKVARSRTLFNRFSPNHFVAGLIRQVIQLALILVGLVLALVLMDATAVLSAILGAAGIAGLAVGFAVRDSVENYVASILLSIRNPFETNDLVLIEGYEGNVVKLTSRATILISLDGNHIRIPNAVVFKAVITNYTREPLRRFQFDVGVDTGEDLLGTQALALETVMAVPGVLAAPKPLVVIEALGDSNVLLRIYGWLDQRESNFAKVRSEAIRRVKEAFDRADIDMPEPIYRLKVYQESGERGEPRTQTAARLKSETVTDIQDVREDGTMEKKIQVQATDEGAENLLTPDAPKEL